jgi:capsular exopolysaccharide synthesis family protein
MTEPLAHEHDGSGLRRYLGVIRRRGGIVLIVLASAVGAAVLFSSLQKSVYRAETTIVIGQGNSLFQPTFANAVQPFTATMGDLVKTNIVATRVIQRLGLRRSPEKLLSKVHVSTNPQTANLKISVDDHDPGLARRIAQALGNVFHDLVAKRFGKPQVTTPAGQVVSGPLTATVWGAAHIDKGKVAPRPVRNVAIAAALGLVLALLAAFLREHFDRRLRTRESVEEHFGVPVIGQIPVDSGRRKDKGTRILATGAAAEAFRSLRVNLEYLGVGRPLGALLITSASPQQGKTTVTANLAAMIARSGATTIAVEGDLRRPRLHEVFGFGHRSLGLTDVLVGTARLEDVVVEVPFAVGDGRESAGKVVFLPSGPLPPNPAELLSSPQMKDLLDQLARQYDYVLIDSSPLLAVADALGLARAVDGVVLVARSNSTNSDEAREVRALVDHLDLHFLGLVLTGVRPVAAYGYGYDTYVEPATPDRPVTTAVPTIDGGKVAATSRRRSRSRGTPR